MFVLNDYYETLHVFLLSYLGEKLCEEFLVLLDECDDLHLVEEDERGQRRQHVLLEDRGRGQHHVLNVLDPVRLVDLGQQLRVVDLDHLVEVGDALEVLAVPLGPLLRRVVFQATDDVEDGVLREHQLEQGVLVEQEDVLEDLVQVVQAVPVLEVLAHVEHVEQLLDVALVLHGHGQLLPPHGGRQAAGHELGDLLESANFARWQLDRRNLCLDIKT